MDKYYMKMMRIPKDSPAWMEIKAILDKEEAAQDAGTSTDGIHNRAEAPNCCDCTTAGPVRQMGR